MKAILFENFGGPEELKLGEISAPLPGPDEVLVNVKYAGVNPVDWKIRIGMFKNRMPHDFPIIPGWDASGVIAGLGKNVDSFKAKDEVFAYCRTNRVKWGAYAEYICLPAEYVAFKPRNISFQESAAIPLAGLTAWQSLFDFAQLKKGESVLIHAGAGGVGSLAIQFAKNVGAYVFTTASQNKHSYVKSLGADVAIDYQKENFVSKIKSLKPEGVDVVFDTVGGQTLRDSFYVLKKGGRLVGIVEPPDSHLAEQFQVKAGYVFVSPNGKQLQDISNLIEEGKVKPIHIEEMPINKAAEAQEKNRMGHMLGKIVLKI